MKDKLTRDIERSLNRAVSAAGIRLPAAARLTEKQSKQVAGLSASGVVRLASPPRRKSLPGQLALFG